MRTKQFKLGKYAITAEVDIDGELLLVVCGFNHPERLNVSEPTWSQDGSIVAIGFRSDQCPCCLDRRLENA